MWTNKWIGKYLMTTGLVALSACAGTSTKLGEQWQDPNYRPAMGPHNVYVIAVTKQPNIRRVVEDEFVVELRKAGVEATASYPTLPSVGPGEGGAIKPAAEKSNATLVLTVRLLDQKQQVNINPGTYSYWEAISHPSYYEGLASGTIDSPDVYVKSAYKTETQVFDVKGDKMVWSATLDTKNPSKKLNDAIAEYADVVVKEMKDDKII